MPHVALRLALCAQQITPAACHRRPPAYLPPAPPLLLTTKHEQIARLLLAYGADINVVDKSGKKPRDVSVCVSGSVSVGRLC